MLLLLKNKQIQINTDSLESGQLKVPQKRNGSLLSKNDQSIFRTNDWVAGSAKALKKDLHANSKIDFEFIKDEEIIQSSKKSVTADSDRSNVDLRLRKENIMLRQEILKLKKALFMNNQQELIGKITNQEPSPKHFNIDNQMIPEIAGSKEFSPEIKIESFPQESLIMNNLMSDPDVIAPYQEIPRPYDELPLKPEICSTNQSLQRGGGTYNQTMGFGQVNNRFCSDFENFCGDNNNINRMVTTDNSLCQNGESIELRLSLINQATFHNKLDGQFQRETEDYRRFTIKDLEKSYDNDDEKLRIDNNTQINQNQNDTTIQNLLQDTDQNILNNLTLSKDEIEINETKDFINNYQVLYDQYEQKKNQKITEIQPNITVEQRKRASSIFEIQRHYELEIENLRKDLDMMRQEEQRIKSKIGKQDFPLSKEFTFKNDGKQIFEKQKNQKSQHDSSLLQTEDPSFCDQSHKFFSNPNSQNNSININVGKNIRHLRYMSNGVTDSSSFIPVNKQIWQPPSFNNSIINTVQNSPNNSKMFNSCFKHERKSFQKEYNNEYGISTQNSKQQKTAKLNAEFEEDYQRLDTDAIEQMFENPNIQKQFMPLDFVQSQKIRYYSNTNDELEENFPKFIKHCQESGEMEIDISKKISQCIKLIDNVQTERMSEESSNYNQSIDFPFRSNQKSTTQSKVYDIKFETQQNHTLESPTQQKFIMTNELHSHKNDSPSFGGNLNFRLPNIYETNQSSVSLKKKQNSVDLTHNNTRLSQTKKNLDLSINKTNQKGSNKSKLFKYPIAQKFHSSIFQPKSQLNTYNQVIKEGSKKQIEKKNTVVYDSQSKSKEFPIYPKQQNLNEKYMMDNNYQQLSNQLQQSRSQNNLNKLSKKTSNHSQQKRTEFDNSACKNSYFQDFKRSSISNISTSTVNQSKNSQNTKKYQNNSQMSNQKQSKINNEQKSKLNNSNGKVTHQKLLNSSNKLSYNEVNNKYQSPFKKRTQYSAGKYQSSKLYSQIQQEKVQGLKKSNEARRNSMIDQNSSQKITKNPKFISKEAIERHQLGSCENEIINNIQILCNIESSRTPQPQSPERGQIESERYVIENQLFMSLFNNARNVDVFNKEKGLSTNRSLMESTQNPSKQSSRINTQNSTPVQSPKRSNRGSIFQKQKTPNGNQSNIISQTQSQANSIEKSYNSTINVQSENPLKMNQKENISSLQSFLQIANQHKKTQQQVHNLFKRNSNISQNSANTSQTNNDLMDDSRSKSPLIQKQSNYLNKSLAHPLTLTKIKEKPYKKVNNVTATSLFQKSNQKSRTNQTIVTKSKEQYFTNTSVESIMMEDTNYSNRLSRQSSNKSITHSDKNYLKQNTGMPQIYGKFIKVYNEVNSRKYDLEPIVEDC